MTKDMTSGSPTRLILRFTIPLIFGNLFQQFYSMVDTIIVGRFLGSQSLAAVGSTGSLNFLILGFCLGLCSGFAIPVSQQFGAKDMASMRRYVGNTIWLSAGASVIFTVLTVLLCRPMLQWMNTPADIIDEAYLYIVVIFAGIPTTFLYNVQAALLRALGDSRTPVIFLVIASFLNIGLDLLLILVIPMGVMGAAVATVFSQLLSGIACFLFIVKKFPTLHVSWDDMRPRREYMSKLCGVGVPMGLQSSITAIGSILLQTSVNALGSMIVAAVTAANRLYSFFACAFDAMAIAMSTYGGQNMGARKFERLTPGLRSGMIIGTVYSALALVIMFLFGRPLITLFVDGSETQIIDNAYLFMIINAACFVALAAVNIFRLLIQGMGYSKMAICAGVMEMFARGIAGLVLVPVFGYIAACFASPFAWVMADVFLVPAYFFIIRHVRQWGV